MELTLIGALLAGLLGSSHCVGMCGGIVSALSFGVDKQAPNTTRFLILSTYNIGRITSYVVAGLLLGGLSEFLLQQAFFASFRQVLQIIAALFLMALGLYIANWWLGLTKVEHLGARLWKLISPIANQLIPVKTPYHGFALGLFWGWLPCGMVYSLLIAALSSGSAVQGGLLMLSFGIGTLPTLLLIGVFASRFNYWVRHSIVRQIAGTLVILFGCYLLYQNVYLQQTSPFEKHRVHTHHSG